MAEAVAPWFGAKHRLLTATLGPGGRGSAAVTPGAPCQLSRDARCGSGEPGGAAAIHCIPQQAGRLRALRKTMWQTQRSVLALSSRAKGSFIRFSSVFLSPHGYEMGGMLLVLTAGRAVPAWVSQSFPGCISLLHETSIISPSPDFQPSLFQPLLWFHSLVPLVQSSPVMPGPQKCSVQAQCSQHPGEMLLPGVCVWLKVQGILILSCFSPCESLLQLQREEVSIIWCFLWQRAFPPLSLLFLIWRIKFWEGRQLPHHPGYPRPLLSALAGA